ncbi:MAG: YegP family protein [Acholeplasmatales bacterium]|nr:YegP family protein [Acholeplasmatales bacterium]
MAEEKKVAGKYLIYNEGGFFYKYRLVANNGQPLIISEAYKDEKACRGGIETLKKNVGNLKVDFEEDKHNQFCFRLITQQGRPLAQSANYKTLKQAQSAAQSYQSFVGAEKIEFDDAESKHYSVELVHENVEDKERGKLVISKDKNGHFSYTLKASNGQVLCDSQIYTSYDSCKKAMENFRRLVNEGDFYIYIDKMKKAFFKLYDPKTLRLVMTGETYNDKKQAVSAIKSILSFAKLAKVEDEK